ncbi:uncharacterized protein [Dermacentor andersoni]|uniref:uncharacterized protein n=1 Tax=Dermacentor andersoni TaxID=34620 RepID=UPI0024160D97|nr:uncharacterized protein LOC129384730 [Dermacentor andersoni]
MDVNDQRHMQLSVSKSGPKKSGAKQRHKQRRVAASSPRPDSTRNHRSPQPITANKAAANELLSDASSPPQAAPSAGAVLSSPSENVGSSSPTESPHLADTHVTSPPAPAEDVASPTKQSGRRRRGSDKDRNKHEVRTSAAPRSGPASSSKAAKATGRFAAPGFFEVPAAKTSQGAAEQITSAPLSSDERQSRDEPEKRRRADAGNDLMSPPTQGLPEAMGETVPTKSTLKGPVRRVSIWGGDFRKESGSGQEEARNAMKKRRLSRASFKDPMATEDIGTSRTTRSSMASIIARMNRKMSMRSTLDTTARSFIPEDKSTLFMASVVFMAILCSVTAAALLFFVTRSDPAAQVACRSRKCIQIMEQLRAIVNDSEDPCLDFYRYVCGQWMDSGGSFFQDNANTSLVSLARAMALSGNKSVDDREGTSVLLHVFDACQEYVLGEWTLEAMLEEVDKQLALSALRRTSTFNDVARWFIKYYALYHYGVL